jgi:hypothetical protein
MWVCQRLSLLGRPLRPARRHTLRISRSWLRGAWPCHWPTLPNPAFYESRRRCAPLAVNRTDWSDAPIRPGRSGRRLEPPTSGTLVRGRRSDGPHIGHLPGRQEPPDLAGPAYGGHRSPDDEPDAGPRPNPATPAPTAPHRRAKEKSFYLRQRRPWEECWLITDLMRDDPWPTFLRSHWGSS